MQATNNAIRKVEVYGLHGQNDVVVNLAAGLNIIHGKNGIGKTTFLHVLANLAERDIERFCYLQFERVVVETYGGAIAELARHRTEEGVHVELSIGGEQVCRVRASEETPDSAIAALQNVFGARPIYLPAFRSILEAITENRTRLQYASDSSSEPEVRKIIDREHKARDYDSSASLSVRATVGLFRREHIHGTAYKTFLCRGWFGDFVPVVRFPSLVEVAEQLFEELRQAQVEVASSDRQSFSDVFYKVLNAVLSPTGDVEASSVERLLEGIRGSLEGLQSPVGHKPKIYEEISVLLKSYESAPAANETMAAKVLAVYDTALRERTVAERQVFERLRAFERSVNRFLLGKRLKIDVDMKRASRGHAARSRMIQLPNHKSGGFSVLSSGERHVLTLLFSATHMSQGHGMLLIDEPELSLHVGWQRIILGELMEQSGDRQIVVCTHAPEVTAEHRSAMISLEVRRSPHGLSLETDESSIDDIL